MTSPEGVSYFPKDEAPQPLPGKVWLAAEDDLELDQPLGSYFSHVMLPEGVGKIDLVRWLKNELWERQEVEMRNTFFWGPDWRDNEDHIIRGTD